MSPPRLLIAALLLAGLLLVPGVARPQQVDCPCSMFAPNEAPEGPVTGQGAIEVGVKFRSSEDGFITALRFFKQPGDTGGYVGHLWNSKGEQLAEIEFVDLTESGWQEAQLDQPVPIVEDLTYIASYHSSSGRVAPSRGVFESEGERGPLRRLADGTDGGNGVYHAGPSGFPTSTDGATNYWVDAVFERSSSNRLSRDPAPKERELAVFVSSTGTDADPCTSIAPCATFARALSVAPANGSISVKAGKYPEQQVPNAVKAVTFRGEGDVKLRKLNNYASNVTFDGIEIDAGFGRHVGFENHDAANVTFKNARIGNVTDEKGALISGRNFTFDRVTFHDVRVTDPLIHNECLYAIGVPGMKVVNSTFYSCATMDLFFTYGDWWDPEPPAYGGVTVENNVFAHTTTPISGRWHYYSMYIKNVGPGADPLSRWTIRHNTFETPAVVAPKRGVRSRWVGNLGAWNCVTGVAYRRNVGEKCSAADNELETDNDSRADRFGWVDPSDHNFRLKADSPAIGAGDPDDHPDRDRDRRLRDAEPDAGAYEHGAD